MPPGTGASHLFSDSDELFLQSGEDQFIYVFQYGVVAFFTHNSSEINAFVKQLNPAARDWEDQELSETMKMAVEPGTNEVSFDYVTISDFDTEAIRLIMLNTSQSVALDKYLEITDELLSETSQYIDTLEAHGTLKIFTGLSVNQQGDDPHLGLVVIFRDEVQSNPCSRCLVSQSWAENAT